MQSNSKLNSVQKALRKTYMAQLPSNATIANDGKSLTILAIPDGCVTRVFTSVASPDEKKFRRKVGEYYALARAEQDGMILPGWWTASGLIDILGEFCYPE